MEKMNTMMQRFIVFVLQCRPIANQLCKSMKRGGPASEYHSGIEKFTKIKDKVFQLMALRNLTFNIDIHSNEEESIWPIKQMINYTLESVQRSWTQFQGQEQATHKFIKEMEHLVSIEESKGGAAAPRSIQKMKSAMVDARPERATKNPGRQRQANPNSPFLSTKEIIARHQEVSDKTRAQFKK